MPKVDPTQYLVQALSNLTGGLISDMQTLFLGVLVMAFIVFGLEELKDIIGAGITRYGANIKADKYSKRAMNELQERNLYRKGSYGWDLHNAKYRKYINDTAEESIKGERK